MCIRDSVTKYRIESQGNVLSYSDVLDLWLHDSTFRSDFTKLLSASPYPAFRWETPAITQDTTDKDFEFVLLNAAGFTKRKTDGLTYRNYFTTKDEDCGIVVFSNISGDATLVVPSPRTGPEAYGHLAAFTRQAPEAQLNAFWRIVAKTVLEKLSEKPIWLSTAGGGVAWLHARLDSRPKYYGYAPYKNAE